MADRTLIVAGLGNPGKEYARTRHNAGFLALDALLAHYGVSDDQQKWDAQIGKARGRTVAGEAIDIVFVRPQTFMNLSGQSVCAASRFYKIAPEDLLVLHDEIDLPLAEIRLKKGGGHAGHNGLRDIVDRCGSRDFYRLRLGVGRPAGAPGRSPGVSDHVLGRFSAEEEAVLPSMIGNARDMALAWIAGEKR